MVKIGHVVIVLGIACFFLSSHVFIPSIIDLSEQRNAKYDARGVPDERGRTLTYLAQRGHEWAQQLINEIDRLILMLLEEYVIFVMLSIGLGLIGFELILNSIEPSKKRLQSENEVENKSNLGKETNKLDWERGVSELRRLRRIEGEETTSNTESAKNEKSSMPTKEKKRIGLGTLLLLSYVVVGLSVVAVLLLTMPMR